MSDIQFAVENAQFPLAHFDAWVNVSRALGHFWTSFSDDVMAIVRAVYAKKGWGGVGKLVETLAPLSGWGPSFAMCGGIMPPSSADYVHTTTTGRLSVSVDAEGVVHVSVHRMVDGQRVEIARFLDRAIYQMMSQNEWQELGGKDECFGLRHQGAVDEVLKYI